MTKSIVMIDSLLPKWERAFACLSEECAQALVIVLGKHGLVAEAVTIEQYHKTEVKMSEEPRVTKVNPMQCDFVFWEERREDMPLEALNEALKTAFSGKTPPWVAAVHTGSDCACVVVTERQVPPEESQAIYDEYMRELDE